MSGFYSNKQIDVIRPYFTKFIEELPELYTKHSFKFVDSFSSHLLPRMEIEDSHIVQLLAVKAGVPDVNGNFANLLSENIELMLRSKLIREFATKQLQQ